MKFFFLALITPIVSLAQTGKLINLEISDTYVIRVKVENKIKVSRSNCAFPSGVVCDLYKIQVSKIFLCSKNEVVDSSSLLCIKYMAVPVKYKNQLQKGVEYTITARPSDSRQYLAFSRILSGDVTGATFRYKYAYITGLATCETNKPNYFEIAIPK